MSAKKAVAIRHIHFEDLGVFEQELTERGYTVEYRDPMTRDLADLTVDPPALLVVLGGPIGVYDEEIHPFLKREQEVIRHRLDAGLPILGLCLGAQLIAKVLGAKVYPMGHKEIGFAPIQLTPAGQASALAGLDGIEVLHWHGDQFDIPEGGTLLAASALCPHQAFSVGPNVLALQFHAEADPAFIDHWLVGHASELSGAGVDPVALRKDAAEYGPALSGIARTLLANWLENQSPS